MQKTNRTYKPWFFVAGKFDVTYILWSLSHHSPTPKKSLVTLLPCCIYCISLYLYRLLMHFISIHRLFRVVLLKPPSVFHGLKPGVSVFVSPEFPWIHRFTPLMEPGTEAFRHAIRRFKLTKCHQHQQLHNLRSWFLGFRQWCFGSDVFFPATKNLGRKIMRDDGGRMGFRTSEKKGMVYTYGCFQK